ncbi:MAG: hypothetical protein SNJ53_03850, partial [Thermodesulfovibrionales bacterium]
LVLGIFISSCSTYYSQRYQNSSEITQSDAFQSYVYCDTQWHLSKCEDKLYSYTKIKQIDFPVDYRAKYKECILPAGIDPAGQISAFCQ